MFSGQIQLTSSGSWVSKGHGVFCNRDLALISGRQLKAIPIAYNVTNPPEREIFMSDIEAFVR